MDVSGRTVRHFTLDPASSAAGVRWNGDDDDSRRLPSGVYVARLRMGGGMQVIKMAITR
jgi:hypothetical protein